MVAKTATKAAPELVLAQQILSTAKESVSKAIAMADRAATKYPEFRLVNPDGGPEPSFAEIAEYLRQAKGGAAGPVQEEKSAPAPAAKAAPAKKAAPKKAAPAPAPVVEKAKPVTVTLKLVHDGVQQTSIYGIDKDSPAHLAIGSTKRGGLGWAYFPAKDCFYLPRTQGYAPDYRKINEAIGRLETIEVDGVQLYRVDYDIRTEVDGRALPVKMSKAEAAEWQREYTAAANAIGWNLRMGQGVCSGCGATGLSEKTGRMGKDGRGLPIAQCGTCGGFGAPTADLSSLLPLALPAAPVKAEVSEPAPVQESAPKSAGRPTAADLGIVVTPAEVGMEVKFRLQGGLSKTTAGELATELRSVLSRRLTYGKAFKGVKVSVYRDKVESKFVKVVVTEGADGFDAAALADEIEKLAKTVRGVVSRMHKG